jgi:hypothetical protein
MAGQRLNEGVAAMEKKKNKNGNGAMQVDPEAVAVAMVVEMEEQAEIVRQAWGEHYATRILPFRRLVKERAAESESGFIDAALAMTADTTSIELMNAMSRETVTAAIYAAAIDLTWEADGLRIQDEVLMEIVEEEEWN